MPFSAPSPSIRWRIEEHGEVDSTNDMLMERARGGETEGLAICARGQRGGRGRQGRSWHSPGGGGLYFSALFRPKLPPDRLASLSLAAGVALAEGLRELTGAPVGLKWPNDLRVHGRKIGGILCEFEPRGGSPPAVVVGTGINTNLRVSEFPPEIREKATSLAAAGFPLERPGEALPLLLERLEIWEKSLILYGFGPIQPRWMGLCDSIGQAVRVSAGGETLDGVVCGVNEAGGLILERSDGVRVVADAGEVIER